MDDTLRDVMATTSPIVSEEWNITAEQLDLEETISVHSRAIADPLGVSVPLPFHVDLFPFGFLTRIKSNDAKIVQIAEQAWAHFPKRFVGKPVELRFVVSEGQSRRCPPSPIFRAQTNLLTVVADGRNFATCDLAGGFGFAHLSQAAVRDPTYFRYNFLEAMTYTLLDALHVVGIHAACLVKDGAGFLFIGDSGSGKSSFAYACARRHWTYLSDDCTFILRRGTGRFALGNPRSFRFRPTAPMLFPEVEGPVVIRNGKPTIEIETERLSFVKTATECVINHVVFLSRLAKNNVTVHIDSLSRQEFLTRFSQQHIWPPELDIWKERQDTIERLLDAQLLQLTYKDCRSAIQVLEQTI